MTSTSTGKKFRIRGSRPFAIIAISVSLLAVAGCGSATTEASSSPTDAPPASAASSSLTTVSEAVAAAYEGTYVSPPTIPAAAPEGKNVWVISCGQAAIGCSTLADSAVDAAKVAGFEVKLFDGKLGADNAYATGIRQAIAAKADGIVVGAIDCPAIKQPLAEAKAAGIPVVGQLTVDCDDPSYGSGQPLFSAIVGFDKPGESVVDYSKAEGRAKADWVIAQTQGKAVALSMRQTDGPLANAIADGFDDEMKSVCPSCTVIPLTYTLADQGSGALPSKLSQALLSHHDVNAVMAPFDAVLIGGEAQAIQRSADGRSIAVIGGEGYPGNLALMKNDAGEDAVVFESTAWMGWGAVDSMIRLFDNMPQQPSGIGYQLFDRDHMPTTDRSGYIQPSVDYQSVYRKDWGK